MTCLDLLIDSYMFDKLKTGELLLCRLRPNNWLSKPLFLWQLIGLAITRDTLIFDIGDTHLRHIWVWLLETVTLELLATDRSSSATINGLECFGKHKSLMRARSWLTLEWWVEGVQPLERIGNLGRKVLGLRDRSLGLLARRDRYDRAIEKHAAVKWTLTWNTIDCLY